MILAGLSRSVPQEHWARAVLGWLLIAYVGFVIYTWLAGLLVRGWILLLPPKI